jgi:RNA polymerase sigma-70 factor (ECF subfamily)
MITTQEIGSPNWPSVSLEDDLALVRQAQQNKEAFAELYRRHATRVYRYLLVRVGNADDAQDLTSQTFMAAMEGLPRFRQQTPFVAWLLGIARHKAADHFRARRPEQDLETAVPVPDHGDSLDELVGRTLQMEMVTRKLQTISPDRAEALALRLFAGLEVAEIARMMEKNEAAVRMLVFRGLRDLQMQLGQVEETQP